MKNTLSSPNKKQKYFVVWKGRQTGIFDTWEQCQKQVQGYPGSKFKSFESLMTAEKAFQLGYEDYLAKQPTKSKQLENETVAGPVIPSYCVDASCIINPGVMEYRCVETETGKVIFSAGPFKQGTNNIGEFLAIVHALSLFKRVGNDRPIYSDSRNAIAWVRGKKCRTKLAEDEINKDVFELVRRAEVWLKNNTYQNKILKWNTQLWKENPADYKRK
jgi:ribonuclease HI